jgi:hypothetical protein
MWAIWAQIGFRASTFTNLDARRGRMLDRPARPILLGAQISTNKLMKTEIIK